jgi:phosphotransferase system  glucose/maltose/N-acetylglucosamine-specific IIC component
MKQFDLKMLSFTTGIAWSLAVVMAGLISFHFPGHADSFLKTLASLYPGYEKASSFTDVAVGTTCAFADGGIQGLVFGWIYNSFAEHRRKDFRR